MSIEILSKEVISLIAAGEVINSLAAVVRELVENAIDAGADRISISIYPEVWRVQVADNGHGITQADLSLCSQAHSTSKIRTHEDLWRVTSLGFRGEALHSIAQVARLTILSRSRHDDGGIGWRTRYTETGEILSMETVPLAIGTVITVENLFGNMPVRRKALPPMPQQLKAVQSLVQDIALCHPRITWQCFIDDKLSWQISPSLTPQQILPQLLKSLRFSDLESLGMEIETPEGLASRLDLVIGLPDRCHRHQPDWVKMAVNGRMVRSNPLEQTLLSCFARTLPRDRFPVCFLHLHTCPSQVDWNRHPAKAEIYLQCLDFWREQIGIAVDKALKLNPDSIADKAHNHRVGEILKAAEANTQYKLSSSDNNLLKLQAIAQVRNTYIVAEHSQGLWLVEQHIAHERVLYEELEDKWELIPLETPIVLSKLKTSQIEQLKRLGIDIETFGENLWAVRNAPILLAGRADCPDAMLELSLGGDLQSAQVATACRSAIRNGTPLTIPQMQDLIDQWQNTRNPRTCPHGRPIYLSLEETSLSRFFRRHWVIGKSHGI